MKLKLYETQFNSLGISTKSCFFLIISQHCSFEQFILPNLEQLATIAMLDCLNCSSYSVKHHHITLIFVRYQRQMLEDWIVSKHHSHNFAQIDVSTKWENCRHKNCPPKKKKTGFNLIVKSWPGLGLQKNFHITLTHKCNFNLNDIAWKRHYSYMYMLNYLHLKLNNQH